MWSNGTVISQQARRAMEHEKVTIVSHATGYIHLLYPEATIDPKAYAHFSDRLKAFLEPPEDAADKRLVVPRLPDAERVSFVPSGEPLGLTPEMDCREIADRLELLRATNRTAALAPYAAHDLGRVESAPFVKAALERCPVSKTALEGRDVVDCVAKLGNESIYDGPGRCASPDEVWNFGRGDGFEKCLLVANAMSLKEGEIAVSGGEASLIVPDREGAVREICRFKSVKRPSSRVLLG